MKSLINLCTALLDDSSRLCLVDTTLDLITIKKRVQNEGESFLTITLPDFASDFERGLELCRVDSTLFVGWRRRGCLPAFLQGFTSLVFGTNGRLLYEPNSDAVFCIRQICRFFKKVRLSCSEKRISSAFKNFRANEAALPETLPIDDPCFQHFADTSACLWSGVFGSEFNTFGLVPKHGPGATSERISGNAKYAQSTWNRRLECLFPVTEFYFTSVNHMFCDVHGLNSVAFVDEPDELPVRVVCVPKTLKAPRIIAIEPVCMQYTQQAVGRWIVSMIQRSDLTRSVIRFNDQSVNQRMAISASSSRSHATIDLSDASDRVPLSMVQVMLASCPDILDAILACRSRRATLPDGQTLTLKKFASMGSALCFPVESMYFYTIIVHAILWAQRQLPSRRNLLQIARRVHVFGDDIIVPKDQTNTVLEALAKYYCKVNATKSFWNGQFRESCGADAFRGVDVTPIYLREMPPSSRRASSSLISWISTSNLLFKAGMWKTADAMKIVVESLLGSLPVVADTSPGLGWYSFQGLSQSQRLCTRLHKPLVRTYKVLIKREKDPLDGYPALLKYFLNAHHRIDDWLSPITGDKKHLAMSARCGTVSRKRQWVSST